MTPNTCHPQALALPVLPLGLEGRCLRGWQACDAASLHLHINQPDVSCWLSDRIPDEYTMEMAQDWVNGGALAMPGRSWAVAHGAQAVGSAGIHPQTEAFQDPCVMRVVTPIRPENSASQRVCEKNGFVREGLLRMSALKKGRAVDIVRDTWVETLRLPPNPV